MKTFTALAALVAGTIFTGCGKSDNGPPGAPSGYVGALVKGQQTAVKTIDVTSLNQEIQLFNAQEGRNPKDLDELVSQHYIPLVPDAPTGMKLVYDAAQGKVSAVPQ